jgi:hypothetical protein
MSHTGLTQGEIERRAERFSYDWREAAYEKGETQTFYNEFFEIFGVKRRSVARYEEHVRKLGNKSGFIDLFWPGNLIVEHKSAGKDLSEAAKEAAEYFDAIPEEQKPRYQLVCDFQRFELRDLDTGEQVKFALRDLSKHIHCFAFILGDRVPSFGVQVPVNQKAARLVSLLHGNLLKSGYSRKNIDRLLVRIVFCLFADCTGIFRPRGHFADYVHANSSDDGKDLGRLLSELFQVLNEQESKRQKNLDSDLASFPYINGDLFAEPLPIARFDKKTRELLLQACNFDWSRVSPAIFGSLFQSVLSKEDINKLSRHPTSEANILKVLNDLFLHEFASRLKCIASSSHNKAGDLRRFLEDLRTVTVFDPACGCGNFLAIAYRELRRLETEALIHLGKLTALNLHSANLSLVDVDQFYGIEISEYSARIAETSLWMTDHIMNTYLSSKLKTEYRRVPLRKTPIIKVANALKTDWKTVLPPESCAFVVGNPPYKGSKKQTHVQRQELARVARSCGVDPGTLDYASAWVLLAAKYGARQTKIGFVVTNSLVEGEQAAQLWPTILGRYGFNIYFAHQTFVWQTDGNKKSAVNVVIVGLAKQDVAPATKTLYRYTTPQCTPRSRVCRAISPYLFVADGLKDPTTTVRASKTPVNGMPRLRTGTKPIDGNYYIFTPSERKSFISTEPGAKKFIREFIGAEEHLSGEKRFILYLPEAKIEQFNDLPLVMGLVEKVRRYRLGKIGNKKQGRKLHPTPHPYAATPRKFPIDCAPEVPFLIIPEVSSENRSYIPIAYMKPPAIPSNLVKILENAKLFQFGLLTSNMHMAWARTIGGSLENRYRYSISISYNTFPLPPNISKANAKRIEALVMEVLAQRKRYPRLSLRDLYNSSTMPASLKKAHAQLDKAVDKVYRRTPFTDDDDRVTHLLNLYALGAAPTDEA